MVAERRVPLLDLAALHAPLRADLLGAAERVLDSQQFILGPDVVALESEVAQYLGTRHAVACASGSDAIGLALQAVGVRHGDRVLTSPFSFFASAGYIARIGATPVFADIEPGTFNLDPNAVEDAVKQARVKAILPVHLFGGAADLDPILAIARRRGLFVVEDGAQSIGAEYKGRRTQTLGHAGCLSFFPTKNLGGVGDGGMVNTNDPEVAERLQSLHLHGSRVKYHHEMVGWNSRLDSLQAAILRVKLPYLDGWTAQRQKHAAMYRERLAGIDELTLPVEARYQTRHIYNQFTIRCRRRDELRVWLAEQGVGTEIYYPVPLHRQECFYDLGYREGDFPEAERAAREVLSLPVHPALVPDDVEYVADRVRAFFQRGI